MHLGAIDVRSCDEHHAKVRADCKGAGEAGQYDIRRGACSHIKILCLTPKQTIAHAATGIESLVAERAKLRDDTVGSLLSCGMVAHSKLFLG